MSTRIVSGKHKGRRLDVLEGDKIRPTSARTREAVFNILAHNRYAPDLTLVEANVADLCCGTGAFALEALSRGAARAILVDQSPESLKLAQANAMHIGELPQCRILQADVAQLPHPPFRCTLLYVDPPYGGGFATPCLKGLLAQGWLSARAMVLVETQAREALNVPEDYEILDERIYGNAKLTILGYGL